MAAPSMEGRGGAMVSGMTASRTLAYRGGLQCIGGDNHSLFVVAAPSFLTAALNAFKGVAG